MASKAHARKFEARIDAAGFGTPNPTTSRAGRRSRDVRPRLRQRPRRDQEVRSSDGCRRLWHVVEPRHVARCPPAAPPAPATPSGRKFEARIDAAGFGNVVEPRHVARCRPTPTTRSGSSKFGWMPSASAVKGSRRRNQPRRASGRRQRNLLSSHEPPVAQHGSKTQRPRASKCSRAGRRAPYAPPTRRAATVRRHRHPRHGTFSKFNRRDSKSATTHPPPTQQGKNVHEEEVRRLRALRRIRVLGALLRPACVIWFPSVSLKDFEHAPPWRVMAV